jgi:hypothetical protein
VLRANDDDLLDARDVREPDDDQGGGARDRDESRARACSVLDAEAGTFAAADRALL